MGMDTSIHITRGMMWGQKGHGPQGVIGDMDSQSTLGPDPVAEDIWIVTETAHLLGCSPYDDLIQIMSTCIFSTVMK